jgi:single-strand DNA-binding protein
MWSLNKVFITGNLTRDPELRYLPSGTAVAELRLASNRRYKTQQGEERDETCFINVSAWGRQAETCNEFLNKGSAVLIEGRLRYEEWEKDGQKNSRITIVADRVQFMDSPRSGDDSRSAETDGQPTRADTDAPTPAPPATGQPGGDAADDENLPF